VHTDLLFVRNRINSCLSYWCILVKLISEFLTQTNRQLQQTHIKLLSCVTVVILQWFTPFIRERTSSKRMPASRN